MDDEPFDDLLDGVDVLPDSSQESLTDAAANLWTISGDSRAEDGTILVRESSIEPRENSVLTENAHMTEAVSPEEMREIRVLLCSEAWALPVVAERENVVGKIESVFESMTDALLNEKKTISIALKSRSNTGPRAMTPAAPDVDNVRVRTICFPSKSSEEAWRFTVVLRILELMHEALISDVVVTKRDIYYRDPALFGRQAVVDRYVDDVAFTLGVPRSMLNVTAAAKGLVAGAFEICRRDGSVVSASSDREGILVPGLRDVLSVTMNAVKWVLVVEKEATFRSVLASGFWDRLCTQGIVITGKGYPDIATRALLRFLSTPSPQNNFWQPPIYGLMDFDPDGLAILSTYKHGSFALAHENGNLRVPSISWLGMQSKHIMQLAMGDDVHGSQGLLVMSVRDRGKARKMLRHEVFAEEVESEWRRELQTMLMLNVKAELQLLDAVPEGMKRMLETELCE